MTILALEISKKMKCVWCGKSAGLVIRIIINEEEKLSGENPVCWSCIYRAAKNRIDKEI